MVDIHPPHGPVHSIKDFLFHLLTVVIGILIALSLEGLMEWHHHRSLAEQSRFNLISEMSDNRNRLQRGLSLAPDAEQRLRKTIEKIEACRKQRQCSEPGFDWSFGIIILRDAAWKTASTTGATVYMDYGEAGRYTRIYALQEELASEQHLTLEQWLDLQKSAVRIDRKTALLNLSNDELLKIEEQASAALIHTQTEEGTAKMLVDEYTKVLGPA